MISVAWGEGGIPGLGGGVCVWWEVQERLVEGSAHCLSCYVNKSIKAEDFPDRE